MIFTCRNKPLKFRIMLILNDKLLQFKQTFYEIFAFKGSRILSKVTFIGNKIISRKDTFFLKHNHVFMFHIARNKSFGRRKVLVSFSGVFSTLSNVYDGAKNSITDAWQGHKNCSMLDVYLTAGNISCYSSRKKVILYQYYSFCFMRPAFFKNVNFILEIQACN